MTNANTASAPASQSRRWIFRSLLACLLLWLALVMAAEWYWPRWVEQRLTTQLGQTLKLEITVDKVTTDAFQGILHLYGFRIRDHGKTLIGFRELHLNYSWLSLLSPTWLIEDAVLIGPEIFIDIPRQGPVNLIKLLPPPRDAQKKHARWHITKLTVADGRLDFNDARVKPARKFQLAPWAFSLKDIGTDSANGQAELHGDLNDGARLDWMGSIDLQPLQSRGRLQLQSLYLPELMRWLPDSLPIRLSDGRLSMDLDYDAKILPELKVNLRKSGVALDNIKLRIAGETLADLREMRINGIDLSYPAAVWGVDSVRIRGGEFLLERARNGQFRIQTALAKLPQHKPATVSNAESPAWAGSLKTADINDVRLRFSDESTTPTTRLSLGPLSLSAQPSQKSGQKTVQLTLQTAINQAGKLQLNGLLGMPSVQADGNPAAPFFKGRIQASELNLNALEGYVRQSAQIRLINGKLGFQGNMAWQAGAQPLWTWQGDIGLKTLEVNDARDNSRLLAINALALQDLAVQGGPNRIAAGSIMLDQLFLRVSLRPDGKLNLATLNAQASPAAGPAKPAAQSSVWPLRIDTLTLRNNGLLFADQRQQPAVSQVISAINGHISDIQLPSQKPANIAVTGNLPPLGTLALKGKFSMGDKLNLDLALNAVNIDLTGLNPYAERYAGYRIDKGRLDAELKYLIEKNQLTAKNHILLKEFAWGQAVNSAEATGLPVRLAAAVLKDVNGHIDIELPLSGSLDDPKFRVWPLVWQALGNLVTRAAATPFKILGALADDDVSVSAVTFSVGSSELSDTTQTRLGKLANALKARPGLQLEVRGSIDPVKDKAALAKARLADGNKEVITEDDLQHLARARAGAILNSLTAAGVAPAQLFQFDANESTAKDDLVVVNLSVRTP